MSNERSQEFSRRVDVQIVKDEPKSRDEFIAKQVLSLTMMQPGKSPTEVYDEAYGRYLDRFQPYRRVAKSTGNGKVVAWGESYFNEADCIENIELNYGDDTTVYRVPMFGEDRSESLLRYGVTDRASQA